MLRDTRLPPERLSPLSRLVAAGIVLLGGLTVVGLRGPAAVARADAADAPAAQAEDKES